jgi:hypothetical protein
MLSEVDIEEDGVSTNTWGVKGARERSGRYGSRHVGRMKTGIKSGRGSPNGRGDEEEYHPTGSNFVVPSVDDEIDEEISIPFQRKIEREEKRRTRERMEGAGGGEGETALSMTDSDLVSMLKLKPKRVPQLRTEEGFQQFFNGIPMIRMRKLLETAYEHLKEREREKKVMRRLRLLDGHMVDA